jgi:integral membrane protein
MSGALLRFRVMAWITGLMLLLLAFAAMPLKYLYGRPELVEMIGPVHGFLYAVYVIVTFDLARRIQWRLVRTVLMLLAGTVPFASFVADRSALREISATRAG